MRNVINNLANLKYSRFNGYNNFGAHYDHKCYIFPRNECYWLIFTYNLIKVTVQHKHIIQIRDFDCKEPLIAEFKYECEDKNEFFQLSTATDYLDITYDDLKEFQNLCDFMIVRYLNEKKEL